ncbi:uncharacterized protein [Eurosta solidaginis]|uniref:uncharacterized protein n=1 Tax=Eurosta solidaginis TaxID=178769 RepID=UPI003531785A
MTNIDFLQAWPKYSDSRAPELIKLDFKIIYLDKDDSSTNKDTQAYILTLLLTGVLPPSSRFQSSCGKLRKKATIADLQESFVLRLTSVNDYERKINELTIGMTIQPFIIVEGIDKDICFKMYQTLFLKYPQERENSWVFCNTFFMEFVQNMYYF